MAASSASLLSCVCWECLMDDVGFLPYPPDVSHKIELAYSRREAMVDLTHYTVDLQSMLQFNKTSGYERVVRRNLLQLSSDYYSTAYWTWEIKRSHYVPYKTQASIMIEEGHQSDSAHLDLSTTAAAMPYTIDYASNEQISHLFKTRRSIRRCQLPSSGTVQSLLTILPTTPQPPPSYTAAPTPQPPSYTAAPTPQPHGYTATPTPQPHSYTATPTPQPRGYTAAPTPQPHGYTATPMHTSVSGTSRNCSSSDDVVFVKETKGSKKKASASKSLSPRKSAGGARKGTGTRAGTSGGAVTRAGTSGGNVAGLVDRFKSYVKMVESLTQEQDEPCPICMNNLTEVAGFDDETPPSSGTPPLDVCDLSGCGHKLHRPCFLSYLQNTATQSGFQCPTCKKSYGIRTGDMPDGKMVVTTTKHSLPGHEGEGTIQISYSFSPGVHNGKRYRVNGFPRICYLPNSSKGQKILGLLRVAWKRRLTFTIGTSVTTGATDTVVWNEIHHKTETSNCGGHGYPDPNYLDNVMQELAAQGVTEQS